MKAYFATFPEVFLIALFLVPQPTIANSASEVCWNVGNFFPSPTQSSAKFSPDQKHALFNDYQASETTLVDLQTGETKKFSTSTGIQVGFLKSGELAISKIDLPTTLTPSSVAQAFKTASVELRDLKTDSRRTVPGFALGDAVYKVKSDKGGFLTLETSDGHQRRLALGENAPEMGATQSYLDPDTAFDKKTGILKVYKNEKTLAEAKVDNPKKFSVYHTKLSADRSVLVIPQTDDQGKMKSVTVLNLKTKEKKSFEIKDPVHMGGSSGIDRQGIAPDGKSMLLSGNGIKSLIMDLTTGSIREHQPHVTNSGFDRSGNLCGEPVNYTPGTPWNPAGEISCYNLATGKVVSTLKKPAIQGFFSNEDGDWYTIRQFAINGVGNTTSMLWNSKRLCGVKPAVVTCDCQIPTATANPNLESFKEVAVKAACGKDHASKDWEKVTSSATSLTEKDAYVWLKKFSKPGGFLAAEHLEKLLGILNSEMTRKYPGEVKAALTGVLANSSPLYEQLLETYPKLRNIKEPANQDCLTENEKKKLPVAIIRHAERMLSGAAEPVKKVEQMKDLLNENLNETQREALADYGGDRVAEAAAKDPQLTSMFASKTYKFGYKRLQKILNLPAKDMTDFTVTRDAQDNLNYYLLGTMPFEGAELKPAGFYVKSLSSVPASSIKEDKLDKIEWEFNGKKYKADVSLDLGDINKKIVNEAPSPNYKDLWKNNTLRGLVVAGSNLGDHLSPTVIQDYVNYYVEQGFEFDYPVDHDDLPGLLKDRVSGAEPMQYFIKEAHSDGDEKNLFRINKKGKILKGTKKVGDRTEIVELVYPAEKTYGATELISNKDFGDWMQEREKKNQSDLLYLNSSCGSLNKAVYEVSAAASTKFVNIPTVGSMEVFQNKETNVMRTFVDGIRKEKSYAEIRKDMENNPTYKSKSENVFVMPDEPTYNDQLTKRVRIPIAVDTKISETAKNGTPKAYSIEDQAP